MTLPIEKVNEMFKMEPPKLTLDVYLCHSTGYGDRSTLCKGKVDRALIAFMLLVLFYWRFGIQVLVMMGHVYKISN